jgi:hypothetical protein
MDWRELHLARRHRAFNFAHRWVKVLAIAAGFPITVLSLMASFGIFTPALGLRALMALLLAVGVPALVARLAHTKGDPLVSIGLPSETYAWILLGFAVLFLVVLHDRTRPLLLREGDRDACEGLTEIARAAWFLGGVKASTMRAGAAPCRTGFLR